MIILSPYLIPISFYSRALVLGVDPVILDISEHADIANMVYKITNVNERHSRNLVGVVIMADLPQVGDDIADSISVKHADAAYNHFIQGQIRILEVNQYLFHYMLVLCICLFSA